MIKMSYPEKH